MMSVTHSQFDLKKKKSRVIKFDSTNKEFCIWDYISKLLDARWCESFGHFYIQF